MTSRSLDLLCYGILALIGLMAVADAGVIAFDLIVG